MKTFKFNISDLHCEGCADRSINILERLDGVQNASVSFADKSAKVEFDSDKVSFEKVQKVEAFSYLHQEIYRREYLFAMPEAEAAYLKQISGICEHVSIIRIQRPQSISIGKMHNIIEDYLNSA